MFVRDVVADFDFLLQRQLFARSERVKGIDVHPHEPWILTTLYSGTNDPTIRTCYICAWSIGTASRRPMSSGWMDWMQDGARC